MPDWSSARFLLTVRSAKKIIIIIEVINLPIIVEALDELLVGVDGHRAGKSQDDKTNPAGVTESSGKAEGSCTGKNTDNVDIGLEVGSLSCRGVGISVTLARSAGSDALNVDLL